MSTMAAKLLGIASAWSLFALGCVYHGPLVWTETTEEMTLPVAGTDTLQVETHNGRVTFEGKESASDLHVLVKKRAGGGSLADAEACMEAIDVFARQAGSTRQLGWRWKTLRRPHWASRISFEVDLPRDFNSKVTTHNGTVRLSGLAGRCQARTHNGEVHARGLRGDCRLVTHNGRVEAQDFVGDAYLETHNGAVVAAGRSGSVTLITHNGPIQADLRASESLGGSITTHNGSVKVILGPSTNTVLRCRTHHGTLNATVPLQDATVKRSVLQGRVGTGGDLLEVSTHNGSVTVTKPE